MSNMKLIMESWKHYVSENEDSDDDLSVDIDWRFPWRSLPPDELETMLDVYVKDPLSQEMLPEIAYHPRIVQARKELFTAQWEKCSGKVADVSDVLGPQEGDEELIRVRQDLIDARREQDRMIGNAESFEDLKVTPEFVELRKKIADLKAEISNLESNYEVNYRSTWAARRAATGGIGGGGTYGCGDFFMSNPTLSQQVSKWEKFWGNNGVGRVARWKLRDQESAEAKAKRAAERQRRLFDKRKDTARRDRDKADRRARLQRRRADLEAEDDRRNARRRAARLQRQRDREERSPSFTPSPLPLKEE